MDDMEHVRTHYSAGALNTFGFQPIELTRHMPFQTGNAVKYVMRADFKDQAVSDLEKALVYGHWAHDCKEPSVLPDQQHWDAVQALYLEHISAKRAYLWSARILSDIVHMRWLFAIERTESRLEFYRYNGGKP